jgi:tetratricopeptide (TPR) repeat protein
MVVDHIICKIVLFLSLLGLSLNLQANAVQKALQYRFKAIDQLKEDPPNWSKAMELITWAVQENPRDGLNYFWRAHIRRDREGKYQDLERALHLNTKLSQAYHLRAQLYAEDQQYKLAIKDYSQVIQKQPLLETYFERGEIYFILEQWNEAIHDFTAAIDMEYSGLEAYVLRARAYAKKGAFPHAIADYETVIHKDPYHYDSYYNLGVILMNLKNYRKAVWAFNRAYDLNSEDIGLINNLGLARLFVGNYAGAHQSFQKVIQIDPTQVDAYNHLGNVSYQQGNLSESIIFFTEAITLGLDSAGIYYNRARAYHDVLALEEAALDLRVALKKNVKLYEAYRLLGDVLVLQEKWKDAIREYKIYLKSKDYKDTNVLFALAEAWMKLGNYEESLQTWSLLLVLEPRVKDYYFQRARAYTQLGALLSAIKDYQMVLFLDPQNAEAHYNWGNLSYRLGHFSTAVEQYDIAIQYAPTWREVYYNRSLAKDSSGDHLGAQKDLSMSQLL